MVSSRCPAGTTGRSPIAAPTARPCSVARAGARRWRPKALRPRLAWEELSRSITAHIAKDGYWYIHPELDELSRLAVRRGRRFIAWEYLFDFGGGPPPWMSGMAQATAITALARGARLLNRPDYDATAEAALGAFETQPPLDG
jgi:hypothetical protein